MPSPQSPQYRASCSHLQVELHSSNPSSRDWESESIDLSPRIEFGQWSNPEVGSESPSCQRFRKYDQLGTGVITADELARCWASSSPEGDRTTEEQLLIAASVHRSFQEMDVDRDGRVNLTEWMHWELLQMHSPGPVALAAINEALRKRDPDYLAHLVQMWERADVHGSGALSSTEVAAMLRSECIDCAESAFQAMDADESGSVSYAEFCVFKLGLKFTPVELHYYDLSKCVAKRVAPVLFGHSEEGIWHTSIVAFGKEYCYHGTIRTNEPGSTWFGSPTKTLKLGLTLRQEVELANVIKDDWDRDFQPETYDAFEHNCNTFCDKTALFLLGRHIPDEVRLLSKRLCKAPVARLLRPVLNGVLGHRKASADTKFGFTRGEFVNWKACDHEIMFGMRGEVVGFTKARVRVKFPPGTWAFSPNELVRSKSKEPLPLGPKERRLTEECVLFDVGTSNTVVARILVKHADGTSDVCWFDSGGRRRVSARVKSSDIGPYSIEDGNDDPLSSNTFHLALDALQDLKQDATESTASTSFPSRSRCDSSSPRSSVSVENSELSPTRCPARHQLRANRVSWLTCHSRVCDLCGSSIPRGTMRMYCKDCRWSVCCWCWDKRRPYDLCSITGGVIRCPKGHRLERLIGQNVRRASCKVCLQVELGSTSACFFSCRPCGYDICPVCAENQAQELAQCGQPFAAPPREHEANIPVTAL